MKHEKRAESITRDTILRLLSDEETARVSRAETAIHLTNRDRDRDRDRDKDKDKDEYVQSLCAHVRRMQIRRTPPCTPTSRRGREAELLRRNTGSALS